jgi:hypothetical protein
MSNAKYVFSFNDFKERTPESSYDELSSEIAKQEEILLDLHEERRFASSYENTQKYVQALQRALRAVKKLDVTELPDAIHTHDILEDPKTKSRLILSIQYAGYRADCPGLTLNFWKGSLSNIKEVTVKTKFDKPRAEIDDWNVPITNEEKKEIIEKWCQAATKYLKNAPKNMLLAP